MTDQLLLQIKQKLPYSATNFFIHSGVADCISYSRSLVASSSFDLIYVHGAERAGKTHLSIYLSEEIMKAGGHPEIVEGDRFEDWCQRCPTKACFQSDVYVIDDADQYLLRLSAGDSGTFVAMVEHLRMSNAALILLSATEIPALPCDEHVMSRLLGGSHFELCSPAASEMNEIIKKVALQRGIHLSEKKLSYIYKRVGRDIPAIERCMDRVAHLSNTLGLPVRFELLSDALGNEDLDKHLKL